MFPIVGDRGEARDPLVLFSFSVFRNIHAHPESQLAMALSLRLSTGSIGCLTRPTAASSSLSIPRSTQCRPFSQAPQRWGFKTQNFGPPSIAQPSMKVRQKEALKDMSQLPNDIGLLPGTFVRPLWRDMPSIFQNPKERWVMERASVVTWFLGLAR